jgi:mono/diheme cytochrome c family protein
MEDYPMEVKRNLWNSFAGRGLMILLLSGVLLMGLFYQAVASSNLQSANEGRAIFDLKCKACHTIGGGVLVGPDLEGVTEGRERDWLIRFIGSPDQMLAEGDPIATGLLAEYNNVAMPNLGLTDTEIESLLAYFETGETTSQVDVSLQAGQASLGEEYFTGKVQFRNGGTPCMACHTVGGVGNFGGGNLGPDLTHVYQRYGEAGLVRLLQNIAFPTMQEIYKNKPLLDNEVADLMAFFAQVNETDDEGAAERFTALFWAGGSLGAVLLFGLMAIFWPRQRESISDKLRKQA